MIKLKEIASIAGLTVPELSLVWVLSLKQIKKVLIGVDNVAQLTKHLESSKRVLSKQTIDAILSISYNNEKVLNPSLWN